MDGAKRERLEAVGWRVASVTEFLSLSQEDVEHIELKLRLADAPLPKKPVKKSTKKKGGLKSPAL